MKALTTIMVFFASASLAFAVGILARGVADDTLMLAAVTAAGFVIAAAVFALAAVVCEVAARVVPVLGRRPRITPVPEGSTIILTHKGEA